MTGFWKHWMTVWCLSVGAFGVVLTTGAINGLDGPVRILLSLLSGGAEPEMTPFLRFCLAVMGPVTLGWCLTLFAAITAANRLDHAAARPVWMLITAGAVTWFVIDSALSVATGFWRNVIPNTGYLIAYLLPVLRTGVLRK